MKPFTESLRYEYPDLTPDSIIVDCGGYHGQWFSEMVRRYKCRAIVFEPYWEFFKKCVEAADGLSPSPHLINAAVTGRHHYSQSEFFVQGDMTGKYAEGEKFIPWTVDAGSIFDHQGEVALFKINCEGLEHEILRALIADGLIQSIHNIQVQFHFPFHGAKESYEEITELLELTHEPEWDSAPAWQNWRRR